MSAQLHFDFIIVGGGIVGLATGIRLLERFPRKSLLLIEKDNAVAQHQTGHNSGVIHSGLYYKPGSLKALNCLRGYRDMISFCTEEKIPFDICGKIVVAKSADELPRLKDLADRGIAHGLKVALLEERDLQSHEPHVIGVKGLFLPETGIVDYALVAKKMAERIVRLGGAIRTGVTVAKLATESAQCIVTTSAGTFTANAAVNCAGLFCDRIARTSVPELDVMITPFRGEYYELKPAAERLVKNLIYPVPDPRFPFLGVHFTRMMKGGIEAGPNAVLALAREGYSWSAINFRDMAQMLSFPGLYRMIGKYWKPGLYEVYRSLSKGAFVRAMQELIPDIKAEDVFKSNAGVRAQALTKSGLLLDDFKLVKKGQILHVCNAPSPAATSSLSIGTTVAEQF